MGKPLSQLWAAVGESNLDVAEGLFGSGQWRSAISRSYYSAYASAHAVAIHLDQRVPLRGNWSHGKLPDALQDALKTLRVSDPGWKWVAMSDKQDLTECFNVRVLADYVPNAVFDIKGAEVAIRCARRLNRRRKEILS